MRKILYLFFIISISFIQLDAQCACCAGAGSGSSNGNYCNGILSLKKRQIIAEANYDYRRIKEGDQVVPMDSIVEGETALKSIGIASIGLRYGINEKISLSASLPYAFLHTEKGNDKGVGDLVLLGNYNLLSRNNFKLAVQAGIELPTGIQKGSNFDQTTVVVGSGSFDPIAGILFVKSWNKLSIQGNALYKQTTSGFDNNYYGSISIQNLIMAYRLKGETSFCNSNDKDKITRSEFGWSVFGGYSGEWLDKITEDDIVDEDSGYYLGLLALGTSLSYHDWSFPLSISLPIFQKLNGDQNESAYRMRIGVIKLF
ncbi:MAG: hypothetical protein ABI851_06005 [Saprospiraceae bacterium]